MPKRRSRGEGGIHWDSRRQRWIGTVYLGYTPAGKRRKTTAGFKSKTEAKNWVKEQIRDLDDGLALTPHSYTVAEAVESWLKFGLNGRDQSTIDNRTTLATKHVVPAIGARRLRDLSADDVDEWLHGKASDLSTDTLERLLSIVRNSIKRAQARDKVKRNVALLCTAPTGRAGRPSKSLTLGQAEALVKTAGEGGPMSAYIIVSLLTGARTEELRALTWDHVSLAKSDDDISLIHVWRSVRSTGDTKTRKSRRTLELPQRCVEALRSHLKRQQKVREGAGKRWVDKNLVFPSEVGTQLDAANVRRAFRDVARAAGLNEKEWTPRELRHSFVSLMSDAGVPIEDIARLVGHASTVVTEKIYRKQLRPVLTKGATAMDRIFGSGGPTSGG